MQKQLQTARKKTGTSQSGIMTGHPLFLTMKWIAILKATYNKLLMFLTRIERISDGPEPSGLSIILQEQMSMTGRRKTMLRIAAYHGLKARCIAVLLHTRMCLIQGARRPFSDDRSGAKTVGSAPIGVERRHRTCGLPVNGRTLCQLSYEPIYFFCRALKLPIWFSVSGPSDYLHDPCVFTDSNRFDSVTGYFFPLFFAVRVTICTGRFLNPWFCVMFQRYCCERPLFFPKPVDWIRTNNNFVPNDLICC